MEILGPIFILLTLAMIPLGAAQLIIAVVSYFSSSNEWAKQQYGNYLLGVLIYFAVLFSLSSFFTGAGDVGFTILFFYGGAIALFVYWIYIFRNRNKIVFSEDQQHFQDPFQA